ncbi:MAG: tetratricopeptide repeat protein [Bacteroidota bacterium]
MRYWLIVWSTFLTTIMIAQNPEQQFQVANKSYDIEEYAVAIEQYQSLLESGFVSPELYTNLGNAYYQFGNLGKAILNFQRALQLNPDDEVATQNLTTAQADIQPELDRLPEFGFGVFIKNIRRSLTANTWATLFLLIFGSAFIAWSIWQIGQQRQQRKWGFLVGCLLLPIAGLLFWIAQKSKNVTEKSKRAVVLEEKVQVRKGAAAESEILREVGAGTTVKWRNSRIQEWQKVRLPNGEEGWLSVEVMEEI